MGFSGDNIPNGLYVDFMNNFEKAYTFNPDWEMALEKAKSDTARSYSETSINGNKQVMWLAPDKALPMGDNEVYLKNLLISKSESLFKKQLEKGSQFGYRYKFEEGTLRAEGNVLYESRQVGSSERQERKALLKKGVITPEMEQKISQTYSVAPGTIRVVQVDSGGNEIKGQLYITSDAKTEMPRPGESPSYGMYFLPDGKFVPKPMYDPENFADVARFSVTKEDIQKANSIKAQRDEAIVNRQKYVNSVNAQITEMREKYGELDYDAP
jgi:hypothetical protein